MSNIRYILILLFINSIFCFNNKLIINKKLYNKLNIKYNNSNNCKLYNLKYKNLLIIKIIISNFYYNNKILYNLIKNQPPYVTETLSSIFFKDGAIKNIKNNLIIIKNIYNIYSYIYDILNILKIYNIKYEYNDIYINNIYIKLSFIPQIYLDYLTLFSFINYFNIFNIILILEFYETFEYLDYSIIQIYLYNIYKYILLKNNIKLY